MSLPWQLYRESKSSRLRQSVNCSVLLFVVVTAGPKCTACQDLPVTAPSTGYLSSLVTSRSGCGSTACPWLLEAKTGQQIKITLYDFARVSQATEEIYRQPTDNNYSADRNNNKEANICRVYATLKESVSLGHTICGGKKTRKSEEYVSKNHRLLVRILAPAKEENEAHFILKYESRCYVFHLLL